MIRVYDLLKNYKEVVERVKAVSKKIDLEADVYVFGSVVRGDYTGVSDIDILVITSKIDREYDIMVSV